MTVVMAKLFSVYRDLRHHFLKQHVELLTMKICHASLLLTACLPDCIRLSYQYPGDIQLIGINKYKYLFLMYLL